jgi:hypothetical protein
LAAHPREHQSGTAATFDQARADFEAAWRTFLSKRTEADFQAWRRQLDWTAENIGASIAASACRMICHLLQLTSRPRQSEPAASGRQCADLVPRMAGGHDFSCWLIGDRLGQPSVVLNPLAWISTARNPPNSVAANRFI